MDKKKILVVEDEKAISDILVFNLQREGYDTLAAYDGAEGLRCALEEAPDLILLDVMLPEMDGFEVCRRVRAEGRDRQGHGSRAGCRRLYHQAVLHA